MRQSRVERVRVITDTPPDLILDTALISGVLPDIVKINER
jgi:hypothetical protein